MGRPDIIDTIIIRLLRHHCASKLLSGPLPNLISVATTIMPQLLVAVRLLTMAMSINIRHTRMDIRYAPLTIYITSETLIHRDVALNVTEVGQCGSIVECHR